MILRKVFSIIRKQWRWTIALPLTLGVIFLVLSIPFGSCQLSRYHYMFQAYVLPNDGSIEHIQLLFSDDVFTYEMIEQEDGTNASAPCYHPGITSERSYWSWQQRDWLNSKHCLIYISPPNGFSGCWETWYANGQIASRRFIGKDIRHGSYTVWTPDREVIRAENFLNGVRHGLWVGYFIDDSWEDTWTGWENSWTETEQYSNRPTLRIEGYYKNGKRDGEWCWQSRVDTAIKIPTPMKIMVGSGERTLLVPVVRRELVPAFSSIRSIYKNGKPWSGKCVESLDELGDFGIARLPADSNNKCEE